jgi:hypothetical protein
MSGQVAYNSGQVLSTIFNSSPPKLVKLKDKNENY